MAKLEDYASQEEIKTAGTMWEEGDKGTICHICRKSYKHENAMIKHIIDNHGDRVEAKVQEAKEEADIRQKEFALERVLDWFPSIEKSFQDDKAEFLQKIQDGNDLSYETVLARRGNGQGGKVP